MESCLQVEALLGSCTIPNHIGVTLSFQKLDEVSKALFLELIRKIDTFNSTAEEKARMHTHLQLRSLLKLNHPLTAPEFQVIFSTQRVIDPHDKESLWNHNKHCLIFFLNWYHELLNCMARIRNGERVLSLIEGLITQLIKLEALRRNFPFCERCIFEGQQCHFWGTVALQVNDLLATSNRERGVAQVCNYLRNLRVPCRIPPSLDAFKNGRSS